MDGWPLTYYTRFAIHIILTLKLVLTSFPRGHLINPLLGMSSINIPLFEKRVPHFVL